MILAPAPPEQEDARKAKTAKKKTRKKKAAKKKKVARKKKAAKKVARKPAVRRPKRKKAATRRRPTAAERAAAAEAKRKAALIETLAIERLDPLFTRAVSAALDRGAASPVLLTRRLGLPFARAQEVVQRMIAAGVLEEASPTGSHAVRIDRADWEASAG